MYKYLEQKLRNYRIKSQKKKRQKEKKNTVFLDKL